MDKPWYKKTKILVGLATLVMMVIGKFLPPDWMPVVQYAFILGIAIIGGHTLTDVAAMFKK
jgi:hypothetical protein